MKSIGVEDNLNIEGEEDRVCEDRASLFSTCIEIMLSLGQRALK